jgi:prolyl oligopeptidase
LNLAEYSSVIIRLKSMKTVLNILLSCALAPALNAQDPPSAPATAPVHEVIENYFGHEVRDPYRYMEEGSTESTDWIRQQAAYTEHVLAALPDRNKLRDRLRVLDQQMGARFQWVTELPGDRYLYSKSAPEDDIYKLYIRQGLAGREHLLVDPEKYRKAGGPAASMQAVYQSRDGNRIACAISIGNSEHATLRLLDSASGAEIEAPIENVMSFASIDWSEGARSFYYRRLPPLDPANVQGDRYLNSAVYRHVIGEDASKDQLIIGPRNEAPLRTEPTHWPSLNLPSASRWALAVITDGVREDRMLYVTSQKDLAAGPPKWRKLTDFSDEVTDFAVHGDVLYAISQKNAQHGKILKISLPGGSLQDAQIVVPESAAVPASIGAARDALYVVFREGSHGRLDRISYATGKASSVPLPMEGIPEVYGADPRLDGVTFTVHGWTRAPLIYAYHAGRVIDTNLRPQSAAEQNADLEVTYVQVASHDGVKVPLTIVHKKGLQRSGDNMFELVGYGSYGTAVEPFFDASTLLWYERGGALAVAHVRGGGELGEEWHRAGMKATKPNTWRDFIACAEYLIHENYTRPSRLVGRGVSAGGILIGRAVTERPDLFGAALIGAGTTDMVRGEFQKNGAVNIPEFGTVKSESDFPSLLEMSAYHHVTDGTKYPAVLLTTGWNDPVVDVWQPAKMAARLQSATSSGRPVLLRVDNAGHDSWGSTRSEVNALRADQLAFMLWQAQRP